MSKERLERGEDIIDGDIVYLPLGYGKYAQCNLIDYGKVKGMQFSFNTGYPATYIDGKKVCMHVIIYGNVRRHGCRKLRPKNKDWTDCTRANIDIQEPFIKDGLAYIPAGWDDNGNHIYAIIDEIDLKLVEGYAWCAPINDPCSTYRKVRVAALSIGMADMLSPPPAGMINDHINHNPLDNRRSNLRHIPQEQNTKNRKVYKNNTSGYKGVSFNVQHGNFTVRLSCNRENYTITVVTPPVVGAWIYDILSIKVHQEVGCRNFPDQLIPKFSSLESLQDFIAEKVGLELATENHKPIKRLYGYLTGTILPTQRKSK